VVRPNNKSLAQKPRQKTQHPLRNAAELAAGAMADVLEKYRLFKTLLSKRQHGVLIGPRRHPDLRETAWRECVRRGLTDA